MIFHWKCLRKTKHLKWKRNIKLYGKYIAFLNLDNKSKEERINDLEFSLKKAEEDLQKQFLEHQNRMMRGGTVTKQDKDEIFKSLPLPGIQFDGLEANKKSEAYDDMSALMITFKEELNSMFDGLDN